MLNLLKSDGEYLISKYLIDNNLNYEYEKKYISNDIDNRIGYKTDFYPNDYDYYIEYMGMYEKFNYKEHYLKKKKFCEKNNFNVLFETDIKKYLEK
jgi:hypothetical protein